MTRRPSNLRALPDPEPEPVTGGLIRSAAAAGRRELLVALRNKVSDQIDEGVPPRDLASLSLRLIALADEIAALDAKESDDDVGSAAGTPDAAWPAS